MAQAIGWLIAVKDKGHAMMKPGEVVPMLIAVTKLIAGSIACIPMAQFVGSRRLWNFF